MREYQHDEMAEIFTPEQLLRMSEGKVIERNGQHGKSTLVDMVVASRRMRSGNEPQHFDTPRLAVDPKCRKNVIVMAAKLTAGGNAQYLVDDGSVPLPPAGVIAARSNSSRGPRHELDNPDTHGI